MFTLQELTPRPPLCFAKRGCKKLKMKNFPLFAKQRGGKEGGEFLGEVGEKKEVSSYVKGTQRSG